MSWSISQFPIIYTGAMTTATLPATYRAIVFESHGNGIEAMKLRSDVTHPTLKPTHVRIRVHSAAVNPADYKVIEYGPSGPQPTAKNPFRSGFDVAGTVVEVGAEVTRF
ncbi:hypothetical protein Poli38472_010001 [Pythium oligandrum]|uniref:Alcohol dehydrogenase-like N-terminal domain-containing protein n=1 Tax=Pythium oligandrum TaxID=41045 RepID=A0A8K1FG84_PYTOL|nr:hypothetical protein Poli38472_010001 [Pythium oligandrum]|eukprot:TMW58442.1 hypothetical protein Poli38472_010001 [Pythium oligandrum]